MLLGVLGAIVAAVSYGAATVIQALGVRALAAGAGAGWREHLRSGRLYAFGLVLDGAGFVASLAALRRLPLFLVQSAVASSIAVTAVLAGVVLDLRLHRREWAALGCTAAGLVLLAASARAGSAHRVAQPAGWLMLAGVAALAIVVARSARVANRASTPTGLAMISGTCFAVVAIAARGLRIHDPVWTTAGDPALLALAAAGVLGTITYAMALERGNATKVAAITFVTETVLPAVVGLTLLGDTVRPHFGFLAAIGFFATVGGCVALARHAAPAPPQPAPAAPTTAHDCAAPPRLVSR